MTHTQPRDPRTLFKQLYDAPVVTSAQIRPQNAQTSGGYLAYLTQVQNHIERKTKIKTLRTLFLTDNSASAVHSSVAELVDVADSAVDIQGAKQAILRSIDDKKGGKTLYVDIYNLHNGHRQHSINVTKHHGAFCSDPTFGRLRWSDCGQGLLYTADRRKQNDEEASLFDKYRYVPSWGEQFSPALQHPRVFYIDLSSASPEPVQVTTQLPDHSLGQPQFGASKDQVIFTAYANQKDGRRLGIIYCQNRPSEIHVVNMRTQTHTLLSNPERAVRSPRFARLENGKEVVVFLSNEVNGPHASNCRIEAVTLDGSPYGAAWSRIQAYRDDDPGLYIDQLPYEPFAGHENGVDSFFATTNVGSRRTVLKFNLINDEVEDVSALMENSEQSSLDCLASDGQVALYSQSAFNKSQQLLAHHENARPVKLSERFENDGYKALGPLQVEFDEETKSWVIFSEASKNQQTRGILVPHGGPHSATTPALSPALATLAATLDVKIVMPNYRGSTGYGEAYLKSLLGKVGEYDVKDCVAAMTMAEGRFNVDSDNWCVYGGSHGGFLAAHLTAQYADKFKCAIIRNPVISLASNATQSDIPDWCYVEAGLAFDGSREAPSSDEYKRMDELSPLRLAEKVSAATLLMAGEDDQRVPNPQTRHWYHALKGHGKTVDMLVFKGTGHPLDSVEAETSGFEATLQWFEKYF